MTAFVEADVPAPVRLDVLERDGHQCQVCGAINGLHLHHWNEYRAENGPHEAANLVTVCWRCHGLLHAHAIEVALVATDCGSQFFVRRLGRT